MLDDIFRCFFRIRSGAKLCKPCRPRQELSNEYLLETFGVDTAENEPLKVCQKKSQQIRKNKGTTYLDERVRLGLAARGGRFVFTRGGLAAEPYADGWEPYVQARLRSEVNNFEK